MGHEGLVGHGRLEGPEKLERGPRGLQYFTPGLVRDERDEDACACRGADGRV